MAWKLGCCSDILPGLLLCPVDSVESRDITGLGTQQADLSVNPEGSVTANSGSQRPHL